MISRRLAWVDILRGFLILIVILGHVLQRGDFNNSTLWNVIYSFHMSAFFVLSGWVGYKESLLGLKGIGHRAKSLLIPLVVWSVAKIIISSSPENYLDKAIDFFLHPDRTYWFLYTLFIVVTVIELWKYLSHKLKLRNLYMMIGGEMLLFFVMVLCEPRIFGFQFIAYYSFFYALGYLIRKHDVKFNPLVTLMMGVTWFIMALFWKMHDVPQPLYFLVGSIPSSLLIYSYRLIAATIGSLFFLNISRILFESRSFKPLEYVGTITLELYVVHIAFGGISCKLMSNISIEFSTWQYDLTDFLLRTVTSIMIVALIARIPKLNKLLFYK